MKNIKRPERMSSRNREESGRGQGQGGLDKEGLRGAREDMGFDSHERRSQWKVLTGAVLVESLGLLQRADHRGGGREQGAR